MAKEKSNTKRLFMLAAVIIIAVVAAILISRPKKTPVVASNPSFGEYAKRGDSTFIILGDYFYKAFKDELAGILLGLPADCTTYMVCSGEDRVGVTLWMQKQHLTQPLFHTASSSEAIMKVWARDAVLSGMDRDRRMLAVSPYFYARSKEQAGAFFNLAKELFPKDIEVTLAPFVFDGGNLVFLRKGQKQILLLGKKTIFDNRKYQKKLWTPGWDEGQLLSEIQKFFNVDSLIVVGRTENVPPDEIYFESRLDMGMTVLRAQTAVVAEFSFGDKEKAELKEAIAKRHPLIQSLFEKTPDREETFKILSERLAFVSEEYDYYASLCRELGLEVHRSPTDWRHVAGRMSWTNVVQVGLKLFMPVYPESANTVVKITRDEYGNTERTIELKSIENEKFSMNGYNRANYKMYEQLSYDIVPIAEYTHYFEGGLRRLVNTLY